MSVVHARPVPEPKPEAPIAVDPAGAALAPGSTVFVAVSQGFASRYLLRTDILPALQEVGARVVVLAPNPEEDYLVREFAPRGVILEPLRMGDYGRYAASRLYELLRNLRFNTLNGRMDLHTVNVRYGVFRRMRRRDGLLRRLYNLGFDASVWTLRRSRMLRRALKALETSLFTPHVHSDLFERYRPGRLVVASLGVLHYDHLLMREARAHGAQVVSVVLSWDNTTTKGMPGAEADRVVAWTETMKQELVGYSDVPAERVCVGGVAHFDCHFRRDGLMSRDELFQRFGLDPARRLLFFAMRSPNKYPWNPEIVERLARAIAEERFAQPCQVLVRLHPVNFTIRDGRYRYERDTAAHLALRDRHPHVRYDIPTTLSTRLVMDMPPDEMRKLTSMLAHADVLLSFFSTMMLEASIFDLPMVNVCLYTHNQHLAKDDMTVVDFPHIRRVAATGGMRTAFDEDELIGHVNTYLLDRSVDAEGRRRIREQECGPFPGAAGRRIARLILES
jgi:hypothetical protein